MAQPLPSSSAGPNEFVSSSPPSPPSPPEPEKLSFFATAKTFPRPFWMCCVMEMWERLAYFGVRVVMPIYIMQADEPGGLHFTKDDKGSIYFWWAIVASGIPMISGGFADRYGYKKLIAVSATINIAAYVMMANMRSYWGFFASVMLLALGTALFKPGLQGTLAQSMSKKNSSVGWGLFYWLVNVGGAIGPPLAGFMHSHGWPAVFYGSAAITTLNYAMLFTYPGVESGADQSKGIWTVVKGTVVNIFDAKLLAVIAIFSGFWMMLYQLWDFMPNFYADWIDSSGFVKLVGFLPEAWLQKTARGVQLKQENALNLNALLIVLFVVPMSFLVARMRVLSAITLGILIATIGTMVYGTLPSIYMVFFGILLFSLGEMLTGPKKTEYFALIAPKGKKALYLGYVNIPVAIGAAAGAKVVAALYGEKATLALRYLAEKTDHHGAGNWDGNADHLAAFVGVQRTSAVETLCNVLGQSPNAVNQLLWDTYKPYQIWYVFGAAGLCSLIGMLVFSRMSRKWQDLDV
ncbi:MFS transporter [Labilithrix luteola]|nr:MFS transporter [Labilithrix luteola]